MKTRIGKIAQLPKTIRTQLNRRLENGQQSPALLKWLNSLPQTKKLLARKFEQQPITKSNLSDWRHGGYQDWRADQAREARIQRISESGASLEQAETGDLFENFARIAVAELMADLDSLPKLRGEKRSQYLHCLVRDLARLQNSFNRSRRTDLAWTKYNDRDSGTGVSPVRPEELSETETQNSKSETPNITSSPSTPVVPDDTQSCATEPHDSNTLEPRTLPRGSGLDVIHYTKCDCSEPCPKCHAPDSDYPLDEALRDQQYYKKTHGRSPHDQNGHRKHLINCDCNCFCDRCADKTAAPVAQAFQPAGSGDFPVPGQSPLSNHTATIIAKPQPPLSPIPLDPRSDFLRKMSHLKSASQCIQRTTPEVPFAETQNAVNSFA